MPEVLLPLHIDSTMRSAFVSCPRKFYHEFCLGLRPQQTSIDLHAGGAFAAGLEAYYRAIHALGKSDEDALAMAHAALLTEWGDFEIPESKLKGPRPTSKTKERMWEAIEGGCSHKDGKPDENKGYVEIYRPRTDHVQPYFDSSGRPTFEYTFAIPLEPLADHDDLSWGTPYNPVKGFPAHPGGTPFLYCGRFDMLGMVYSRPCVRDEKTTGGSIGQAWADQWDLRAQFMGYVWACQQGGLDLDTVVIRGIGIQKTQIVHAEAIKVYPQYMIARWHEQLRRDMWRLRRMWDEGYFDYNFGEACTSYGGCQFTNLCASPQPENWFNDFQIVRWNPLEKNPVKETVAA